jgi:Iron-containing alcohol dehydrogenase
LVIDTVKVALEVLAQGLTRIEQRGNWRMRVAPDGGREVRRSPARRPAASLPCPPPSRAPSSVTSAAPPTPATAPLIGATSVRAYASNLVDLDARLDSQMGAWLAATSIRRAEDGASLPHGITGCVLLPTVMRFNADVCAPQMAEIAAALGDPIRPAADQVEALIARLGLPTRIGQLGVARDRLAVIAQRGPANPWVHTNARRMHSVAGLPAQQHPRPGIGRVSIPGIGPDGGWRRSPAPPRMPLQDSEQKPGPSRPASHAGCRRS